MTDLMPPAAATDKPIAHWTPRTSHAPLDPATEGSLEARVELAGDPTCPPEVQRVLARDSSKVVEVLLGNPGITPEAAALAIDTLNDPAGGPLGQFSLFVAAGFRETPEVVLRLLLPEYAAQVAMNRNCTGPLLSEISRSRDWQARSSAACHKALPPADLLRLVNDPHRTVALDARNSAVRRGGAVAREALLLVGAAPRRRMVARMPARAREALSRDPDPKVRSAVAAVIDDASTLTRLADDPHGGVRRAASSRLIQLLQTGP